jgi:hypothetical protein
MAGLVETSIREDNWSAPGALVVMVVIALVSWLVVVVKGIA